MSERLTEPQARALRAVRLGYVIYDDVDERFYGLRHPRTLQLLDRMGCLMVMWPYRVGRRVPVTISAHGEAELLKWERAQEARSKRRERDAAAPAPVAHGDTHVHYQF